MNKRNLFIFIIIATIFIGCDPSQSLQSWEPVNEVMEVDSLTINRKIIATFSENNKVGLYGCSGYFEKGELHLKFNKQYPEIYFTPAIMGLPESWRDFNSISFDIEPQEKTELNLSVSYIGYKNVIEKEYYLKSWSNFTFNLSEIPLAGNQDKMYHPLLIRIRFDSVQNESAVIRDIKLTSTPREQQRRVLDKFGQRNAGEWEGKVKKVEDFAEDLQAELDQISSTSFERKSQDQYGGLLTGKKYPNNGSFSLYKEADGRYFFVTPEGNPFWSLGVTCVRPHLKGTDGTIVKGREYLFQDIPDRDGKYGEVWADSMEMSFYYYNILRKYGELGEWIDMIFNRFENWGINTIGNWSNEKVLENAQIPFTYSFRTTLNPNYSLGSGLSDVFDPGWERYIDSVFETASRYKDNPFLLGYFVDNEAGWGNARILERLNQNSPGRDVWLSQIRKKYTSIENLNGAWEQNFSSWEEVKMLKNNQGNENFEQDYKVFERNFAKKYFQTVRKTLKKHDPNHLYLGCRFTRRLKPDHILAEAGMYCDAITVNVYSLVPDKEQMTSWYEKTGKPILIGEHHLPLLTEKQFPPHYPAFTSEERNKYYKEYVRTWAELPFSLGCHWYQLVDQHGTGRPSNGENQIIGLVDITDQPYEHMVEAIRETSDSINSWHFD